MKKRKSDFFFIVLFVSVLLNFQAAFFLAAHLGWVDRGVTELEKFTFENYDITVYYEVDVIHRVEEQSNIHTMFFENDAIIMSKNDGLFYLKGGKKVNLCETGNKSFTIDKEGNLVD
ncbi:MAG: hypothetical protein IJO73_00485 [Clostridia bacterium]|nr:hypothetical protein [Clostridia bacterium]